MNKKKSEILTRDDIEKVNGIECSTTVKYLGVRLAVDKKEQIRISKEQISKNVQLLKWRLKGVDVDVLERLTCCLARSMLIYIGTPMAAAGLWKRQDIDRFEAGIYRKILGAANNISKKVILNTMTSMRLAGEAITQLSRGAWEQFKKQNRVTQYFDKGDTESKQHKTT